jgi:hypothetical protein
MQKKKTILGLPKALTIYLFSFISADVLFLVNVCKQWKKDCNIITKNTNHLFENLIMYNVDNNFNSKWIQKISLDQTKYIINKIFKDAQMSHKCVILCCVIFCSRLRAGCKESVDIIKNSNFFAYSLLKNSYDRFVDIILKNAVKSNNVPLLISIREEFDLGLDLSYYYYQLIDIAISGGNKEMFLYIQHQQLFVNPTFEKGFKVFENDIDLLEEYLNEREDKLDGNKLFVQSANCFNVSKYLYNRFKISRAAMEDFLGRGDITKEAFKHFARERNISINLLEYIINYHKSTDKLKYIMNNNHTNPELKAQLIKSVIKTLNLNSLKFLMNYYRIKYNIEKEIGEKNLCDIILILPCNSPWIALRKEKVLEFFNFIISKGCTWSEENLSLIFENNFNIFLKIVESYEVETLNIKINKFKNPFTLAISQKDFLLKIQYLISKRIIFKKEDSEALCLLFDRTKCKKDVCESFELLMEYGFVDFCIKQFPQREQSDNVEIPNVFVYIEKIILALILCGNVKILDSFLSLLQKNYNYIFDKISLSKILNTQLDIGNKSEPNYNCYIFADIINLLDSDPNSNSNLIMFKRISHLLKKKHIFNIACRVIKNDNFCDFKNLYENENDCRIIYNKRVIMAAIERNYDLLVDFIIQKRKTKFSHKALIYSIKCCHYDLFRKLEKVSNKLTIEDYLNAWPAQPKSQVICKWCSKISYFYPNYSCFHPCFNIGLNSFNSLLIKNSEE